MAKREIERTVQPSVIDRLTDTDPRASTDPRMSYADSLVRFKTTVQRDLEWLLNTRRIPDTAGDEFPEVQHSLYHFGVPDVTSMSADSRNDRDRLLIQVEETLALFEPRLENVKISMVEQEGESKRRELRFVVEATLRLDPTPEQVMFDTVLHFSTGQVEVSGDKMREQLLHYYERELTYLRRMGAEFAERYPKVASRLMIEPNKCEDPHVERMLEAFAFLAARVHLKIDDDLPEISETLLSVVYPHYVRPIPAMSIVQFRIDPEQGKLTSGYRVPRGTMLYSRPVDGVPCKFQTCYETTLWPVDVAAAQWSAPDRLRPAVRLGDASAVLRLELRCQPDVTFSALGLKSLRFFLDGSGNLSAALYELLNTGGRDIVVREIGGPSGAAPKTITLPASALQPAGLGPDDGMLPYPGRSFEAYRIIQEYFAFPEKYLFLDLHGFDTIAAAGMGRAIEILIPIPQYERAEWRAMLEAGVNESTLRLGCTPIINLFPQVSEPLLVTQRKPDYQLTADARRRLTTEIFSVDEVTAVVPDSERPLRFRAFYAPKVTAEPMGRRSSDPAADENEDGLYWTSRRRESAWRSDDGTDILLSFVDRSGRAAHPEQDTVTARLTCFNSDLPSRLPFGMGGSDFELDNPGPIREIAALVKPTRVIQPPLGSGQTWRLISQLSLNYLSLVDSGEEALRETLRLYDFGDSASARKQIAGISSVKSALTFARIVTEHGLSFARGRKVELELDEEQFAGGGVFLFGTVLERFLGLYTSLNSFSVLSVRARQRKREVYEWPARSGWKSLL